jgi:tetratricopeptide (TPR) repeat protein
LLATLQQKDTCMSSKLIATLLCMLSLGFAIAQNTKSAKDLYNRGIELQDNAKYAQALESFQQAIAKEPNYREAIYSAGWNSNELKKYSEALAYLQKAKQLWPTEPKVYLELGYAYEKLNKKNDAIANYNKCLELDKDHALAYKYLGILYYDQYQYQKALDNLHSFLLLRPDSDDDDVYFRKAVSENELGNYTQALSSIAKAYELNPSYVKYLNEFGYTHLMLQNTDSALGWYDKAIKLDARSLTALNGRADVYRKLKKDNTEAIRLYNKTLAVDPNNANANYYIGWCYNELNKYSDAIPYLKKAIQADARFVSAFTELGYAEYALKNYDAALATLQKATAIKKTELNVYYSGLCYVRKQDKVAAEKMLNDLATMDSEYAGQLKELINKM